jgi:hypothetical protein
MELKVAGIFLQVGEVLPYQNYRVTAKVVQ